MPPPQTPLDPLPIPEQAPVDVQPASVQAMAGQPLPPSAGWVSPAGAGAYIASNMLTGWMAGRHFGEQRKLEKAKQQVVGAKNVFDAVKSQYDDIVAKEGTTMQLDPSQPLDAGKAARLNQARQNVQHAWANYLDTAQQYAFPEGEEKKGVKGFGQRLGREFTGQQPELFARKSIDVLRAMDPTSAAMTSEDQMRRQIMQGELQKQQKEMAAFDQEQKEKAEVADYRHQYVEAIRKGDLDAAHKFKDILAGYNVTIPTIPTRAAEQTAEKAEEIKLAGINVLADPTKTYADMSPGQRAMFGITLGTRDDYQAQVGPGKLYATPLDADKAELEDAAAASALGGRLSAGGQKLEDLNRALRSVLEHELQTPEGARKWGLVDPNGKPMPLKPGQAIPDWILNQAKLDYEYKISGKLPTGKGSIDKQIDLAINSALRDLPPDQQELYKGAFLHYDAGSKMYSVLPFKPEEKDIGAPWYTLGMGTDRKMIAGIPADQYDQKRQDFLGRIASYIRSKGYPDAQEQGLIDALNSQDAAAYLQEKAAKDKAAAGEQQTAAQGAPQARRDYVVTDPNRKNPDGTPLRMIKKMTPQEAELMRQGNQNWTIEPSVALPATGVPMPRR